MDFDKIVLTNKAAATVYHFMVGLLADEGCRLTCRVPRVLIKCPVKVL